MSAEIVETVTSSSDKFRRLLKSKRFWGACLVIVAVIVAAVLWQSKPEPKPVTADLSDYSATVQYTPKTAAELDQMLAKAKTADEKSHLYALKANNALTDKKFPEAVALSKQAVSAKGTVESYAVLGLSAQLAHDKQTAHDAYQKAADLSKKIGGEEGNYNAKAYEISARQALE